MLKLLNTITFLTFLFFVNSAQACSVCFSNVPDDPANIALKNSVLVLLGVIATVLALFAKFFLSVRRREKLMLQSQ